MLGTTMNCLTRISIYDGYEILPIKSLSDIQRHWFDRFGADGDTLYKKFALSTSVSLPNSIIMPTLEALKKNKIKSYNPLVDAMNLYTDLTKLNALQNEKGNERRILQFISNYGLPCGETLVHIEDLLSQMNFVCMFISELRNIESIKVLVDLYAAINSKNNLTLHRFVSEYREKVNDWGRAKLDNYPNLVEKGKHVLAFFLQMHNMQRGIIENVNGRIMNSVQFVNLFEVASYQLLLAVFGEANIRYCEYCKQPFQLRHDARKFCPPYPGNKRSTCENTVSMKNKRKKSLEIKGVRRNMHD